MIFDVSLTVDIYLEYPFFKTSCRQIHLTPKREYALAVYAGIGKCTLCPNSIAMQMWN